MEWFKHQTGSHDDPDISDAWDELGDFGYVGFFVILEIYGQEYNHRNSDGFITISKTFLRRKLRKSWTKVELLLNFYSKINRIISKRDGNKILIKIPKFIGLASNWTKRKPTAVSPAVPTAKEVEEEEKRREVEKKKPLKEKNKKESLIYTEENFISFYQNYPKHVEKKETLKQWLLLNKRGTAVPSPEELNKIVTMQVKKGHLNLKEKMHWCMSARKWLYNDRWEDEITYKEPEPDNEDRIPDV